MMFTLFDGEKYFDKNGIAEHAGKNVICDVKADFSLKKLNNYTMSDAIKTLNCAKENVGNDDIVRLIFPEKCNTLLSKIPQLFRRGCYYLQQIHIHNFSNLYNELNRHNIYILEDAAAAVCADKTPENHGWIYAAKHSKWRIICGIGRGVVVSRRLADGIDIDFEIDRTLIYLKRFNLAENFCIFRSEEFIQKNQGAIENYWADTAKKVPISPVREAQKSIKKHLSAITAVLACSAFAAFAFGVVMHLWNSEYPINCSNIHLKNNNIDITINEENVEDVKNFIETFRHEFLPWKGFRTVRKKYPYTVIKKISLNNNEIKVYTDDKNSGKVICIKK